MAQDIVNENQKISYTNLDFSSIYSETLDLIKQLTYKWDPSISNESDPGVILVKLSALIADKCNYNIDKNVLETFPLSVTQDGNARQLYDQLGYYMDWYESAIVPIALNYTGISLGEDITTLRIPKFTPISDSDANDMSSKRFCLIGVEGVEDAVVSDIFLPTDGKTVIALAMEGLPLKYQFEGETVITSQMVDPISRRLYFTSSLISQNGIFIKNTNQENYASWKRVNNLYENSYNELRYVFGYDSRADACFLEFPDNYAELFGSGIEITYLLIDSNTSNVAVNELSQFYSPITIVGEDQIPIVTLDSGNVKLTNFTPSVGHKDVEGIDEAYINYKRTVGTFKTLITLRDYLNFILSSDLNICSNAFVCDRTNDIQSTYKIISNQNGLDTIIVKVEQIVDKTAIESNFDYKFILSLDTTAVSDKKYYKIVNDTLEQIEDTTGKNPKEEGWYELESIEPKEKDALDPFSLKFYLLRKGIALDSKTAFNQTFDILNPYPNFDDLLSDTAHLEHVYEDILPLGENSYIKSEDLRWESNKSYWLYNSTTKNYDLIVDTDLYSGAPKDNDLVYEIDVEALLPHTVFFKEIYPVVMNVSTYNVLDTDTQTIIKSNIINSLYSQVNSSQISFGEEISIDYLVESAKNSDDRIKSISIDPINYSLNAVYYDKEMESYLSVPIDNDMSYYEPNSYTSKSDLVSALIKKDIVCKSILAGTTQLLTPDKTFIYHLSQKYVNYIDDVANITSEALIDIGNDSTTSFSVDEVNSYIRKSYTLKDNELISLYRLKLDDAMPFLNGIHFEYILNNDIEADESYKLRKDEYVILYNPIKDDSSTSIIGYTAYACSNGCIIHPTFDIKANLNTSGLSNFAKAKIIPWFVVNPKENYYTVNTYNESYKTEIRNNSSILNNVISGTDSLSIQHPASIDITLDDKYKFFWMLNNPTYPNNNNLKYYTLFNTFDSENENKYSEEINTYTLREGESFIYLLNDGSDFVTLSAGTTIIRNCGVDTSEYSKIENSIYYVDIDHIATLVDDANISFYTDIEGKVKPRENGLYIVEDLNIEPETLNKDSNPFALNLYEKEISDSIKFIPTKDTEVVEDKKYYKPTFIRTLDVVAAQDTVYYILVMRKEEGWYTTSTITEDNGSVKEIYVPSDTSSDCFEEIGLYNTENPTIVNPVKLGYYKRASYNNDDYIDSYRLSKELPITDQYRYTLAENVLSDNDYIEHDSSIVNRKILVDTLYSGIDISNISTYTEIDFSKIGQSSPQALDLLIPTEYEKYYRKTLNGYEEVEVSYLTNPSKEELYVYDENEVGPDDTHYIPTNDAINYPDYVTFNAKVLSVKPAKSISLLRECDSLFSTDVSDKAYLYKPNSNDTKYRYNPNMSNNRLVASTVVDPTIYNTSPLQRLFEAYITVSANSDYDVENPTRWLNSISNIWSDALSFQKPYVEASEFISSTTYTYGEMCKYNDLYYRCIVSSFTGNWDPSCWSRVENAWSTHKFKDSGNSISSLGDDFSGAYIRVSNDDIIQVSNSLGAIYPDWQSPTTDPSFVTSYFYIPARFYMNFGIDPESHYYVVDEGLIYLDNDSKLAKVFPGKSNTVSNYGSIQIFYIPKLYRFNDFVRFTYVKYFKPKELYSRNCGVIDAWSVEALDNDTVASDPIQAIKESWVSLQPNTSLTIIENEIESFASGDTLIFEVNETLETSVDWPVFNNSESVLDLDTFRVYYQKKEGEIKEIKNINVEDYKWRGYSSLILNTSSKSGQKLDYNHSLTLYSDEDKTVPITTIYGSAADNISFQLKYPVQNKAGTFIDVTSVGLLGENLYNSLYVFIPLNNGSDYAYNTVDYRTYLYFNSIEDYPGSLRPQTINIPIGVPAGNYLLPMNMKDDVNLTAQYISRISGLVGNIIQHFKIEAPIVESDVKIDAGDDRYIKYKIDSDYTNYLYDYTDNDIIRSEPRYFEGNKFYYLSLDVASNYTKINSPSYITLMTDKSPSELGWFILEDGEYVKSTNTNKGKNLLEEITFSEESSENPQANGWYEFYGSERTYILTSDTEVVINKKYYKEPDLYVSIYNTSSILSFNIDSSDKALTYIINDIFKYNPNQDLGSGFEAIKEKIKRLDDKGQYNYAFVPKDNDLISNPLEPRSLWNVNHIFNKYTIPQLDFDKLDFRFITTK